MQTIKTFVFKFGNDWSMNLTGMVAYSLITAIFPMLLLILSIAALLTQPLVIAHFEDITAAISSALPQTIRQGIDVDALVKSLIQITGPVAIISLIGLVWLGSNLFVTIENAFSIIFRIRGRDIIPQRLVAVAMVIILTVFLPLSLLMASLITTGSSDVATFLPPTWRAPLKFVGPVVSLGVLWLLFVTIYLVVPNIHVRFRYAWRGALTATVLFGILQLLFPIYFAIFLHGNAKYGAVAATILVVIIWLWFFSLITIIGAQINAVAMGLTALPNDLSRIMEDVYGATGQVTAAEQNEQPPPREHSQPRATGFPLGRLLWRQRSSPLPPPTPGPPPSSHRSSPPRPAEQKPRRRGGRRRKSRK